ncbi:hypothetical protein HBI07_236220 [Parastagonospora nodorum]|nr:hypothetical protein HBI07_236220 [Parastagonospora nodorum]
MFLNIRATCAVIWPRHLAGIATMHSPAYVMAVRFSTSPRACTTPQKRRTWYINTSFRKYLQHTLSNADSIFLTEVIDRSNCPK